MSETSRGPGWWLASDGRWYPPELHPEAAGGASIAQGSERAEEPDWWLASDGRWYPPELHPASDALVRPAGAGEPLGPGWWLASDGRWYPPQLHPHALGAQGVEVPPTPESLPGPIDPEPAPASVVIESEPPGPRRRRARRKQGETEPEPTPEPEPMTGPTEAVPEVARRRRRRARRKAEADRPETAFEPEAEPEPESEPVAIETEPPGRRRRRARRRPVEIEPEPTGEIELVAIEPETLEPEPVARRRRRSRRKPEEIPAEPVAAEPVAAEPVEAEPEPEPEPEPVALEAESEAAEAEAPAPSRRRWRRKRAAEPTAEPDAELEPGPVAADPEPVAVEPEPEAEPELVAPEPEPETAPVPVVVSSAATAWEPGAPARQDRPDDARSRNRRRLVWVVALVVLIGLAAGLIPAFATGSSSPPAPVRHPAAGAGHRAPAPSTVSWSVPALHVLGQPVVADGQVLVLAMAASGGMELVGVNPSTGAQRWQVPFSPSAVPPQVTLAPVAVGDVALALAPSNGLTDSSVVLEGIDVASGRQLWSAASPTTVVDAPVPCPSVAAFCVTTAAGGGGTQLEEISAANGTVMATLAGPQTEMASGLYVTSASPPALEAVSGAGQALWSKTVAGLFGGSQFTTAYGWDFVGAGNLDVGTIGVAPTGSSEPLGSLQTLGISAGDGSVAWSVPGAFGCFGVLPVTAPFVCRYSGSASYVNGTLSTPGVGLTLDGLDESTGKTSWSVPLADAQSMTTGNGVPIVDASHVVVPLSSGPALLDLTTGQTGAVPADIVMWCGQTQLTKVTAAPAALAAGARVTATLYAPCTGQGTPSSAIPTHALPSMGARVNGVFVWASAQGLEGSSVPR